MALAMSCDLSGYMFRKRTKYCTGNVMQIPVPKLFRSAKEVTQDMSQDSLRKFGLLTNTSFRKAVV